MNPFLSDIADLLGSEGEIRLLNVGRRTGLSRPVTVWFILLDDRLFVRTSHRTHWYKNLKAHPRIKAEIGDFGLQVKAEEVEDQELSHRLRRAYRKRFHVYDIFANLFMLRGDIVFFELKPDPSVSRRAER